MSIFNGFMFGLTLQLAVGPVFFAVLHKAIKQNVYEAFKMILGVAFSDALYIVISFTGIRSLLQINIFSTVIKWVGAGILISFGLLYFKSIFKTDKTQKSSCVEKPFIEPQSEHNSWMYGVKLTLTNPLTVLFWSGTFSAFISSGRLRGLDSILFFSLGCVASTVVFLSASSLIAKKITLYLNERMIRWLDYFVGGLLIFYGIKMILTSI